MKLITHKLQKKSTWKIERTRYENHKNVQTYLNNARQDFKPFLLKSSATIRIRCLHLLTHLRIGASTSSSLHLHLQPVLKGAVGAIIVLQGFHLMIWNQPSVQNHEFFVMFYRCSCTYSFRSCGTGIRPFIWCVPLGWWNMVAKVQTCSNNFC